MRIRNLVILIAMILFLMACSDHHSPTSVTIDSHHGHGHHQDTVVNIDSLKLPPGHAYGHGRGGNGGN